jgi:hypothetical protein
MKTYNNELLYNAISNIDENIIISSLNYKPKSKIIIKWSSLVACVCVIAIIFGIVYSNSFYNKNHNNGVITTLNTTTASIDSGDFYFYALPKSLSKNDGTKNYKKVILNSVKTCLNQNSGVQKVNYTVKFKSNGYPYDERDTSYNGKITNQKLFDIKPDNIEFYIESETVVYYNVKVKNNILSYQYSNTVIGWKKSLENIKNSDDSYITWQPACAKFSDEVLSITGKEEPDNNSNIKDRVAYSEAVKQVYNSIENFDDYFGDTLTFELHYKNGTTQTVCVNISLDKNGKYYIEIKK